MLPSISTEMKESSNVVETPFTTIARGVELDAVRAHTFKVPATGTVSERAFLLPDAPPVLKRKANFS